VKNISVAFVLILALTATLPAQVMGKLKTAVKPSRAGIFVDGKYVGPAGNFGMARTYPLAAGEHEITISEPRYQDITKRVTIVAGKTTKLDDRMTAVPTAKPPFGLLRVMGPDKFAAVFLNNKYYGHVDEFSNFAQGIKLNPGEYELKVTPSGGGADHVEKFTITTDKTTLIQIK
jgi:PEGA domain